MVLRHYKKFCRRMHVYDNHSTDNSREIALEEGAIVSLFGSNFFDDQNNLEQKNKCWVGSDADFVICCDCDEILFANENIYQRLARIRFEGATIIKTIGWQIMSNEMPKENLTEITNGFRFDNYSKNIVFNPKAIKEINYGPGAHKCNPVGDVVWSDDSLYVLHYKHIGGVQRTIDRYKILSKRMSKNNRRKGYGIHYDRTPGSLREEWNERMAKSRPLI